MALGYAFFSNRAHGRTFIFSARGEYFVMETKKVKFLEELAKAFGIISVACQYAGICRRTYDNGGAGGFRGK